jgi:murein DD-endopeptidase MepM/ murein hydrolase activator NlpD
LRRSGYEILWLARAFLLTISAITALASWQVFAQPFQFPTQNHALLERGGEEKFFVGTIGKPWTSGMFGCVRTDGRQMHEGLDIKCLRRDKHGEPIDEVSASADGTVAYFNNTPALSNYGKYIILKHRIEDLEIYSTYAHLGHISESIRIGRRVSAGEMIGTMGRTANTREGISKERAHVHFELNLFVNDRFPAWYKKTFPGQRNDHGEWNGQNLLGLDPRLILLAQAEQGKNFRLLDHVRSQNELCRVLVRNTHFPWLNRYPRLIKRNLLAEREGVAGYEIALNYNGLAFQLIPRAPSEIRGPAKIQLLSVNEDEQRKNPCRHLVIKRGERWELAAAGQRLLDLLVF